VEKSLLRIGERGSVDVLDDGEDERFVLE